jgi:hypothetical protein
MRPLTRVSAVRRGWKAGPPDTAYRNGKRMKQISEQDIEKTLGGLEKNDPFGHLIREMEREQPAIAEYLYEAEGNDLNDDERDLLVNFSALAWKIISESLGRRAEASFEYLGDQLERNIDLVEERMKKPGI